jgi:protein MpaA
VKLSRVGFMDGLEKNKRGAFEWKRHFLALTSAWVLSWVVGVLPGSASAPVPSTAKPSSVKPTDEEVIQKLCSDLRKSVAELKWNVEPCPNDIRWKVGGASVQGRPLIHAEIGNPDSRNTTLVFSMVHGDEVTPLYLGLELLQWVQANRSTLGDFRLVVAPLVNPDSFFKKPRTRVNARGVDVNRNFPTRDWKERATQAWKVRFKSNPRRFPGHEPDSEPETHYQRELIAQTKPIKILSVHAPLNFMDYDGPSQLSLERFPKDYIQECLRLRKRLKAVPGGFFPGSLGNYAGQELGIPTLTLELPSADPAKARRYWEQFRPGIRTMIEYQMPEVALRAMNDIASPRWNL